MAMVEGIGGAGMTYQGSVSTVQTKAEAQPKIENAGNELASKEIAKETGLKKSDIYKSLQNG